MRVIEIEGEGRSDRWLWWTVGGVAVGVTAGVLIAERFSGRRPSGRGLWRRARGLAQTVAGQWLPLLELALELKDMWNEREADDDLDEADDLDDDLGDELDEEIEAELEDADEYEEADAPSEAADDEESEIGLRVLEAFLHDPVLAERPVEIEADEDGDVILHGRVGAAREVAHAVTIARGVPGVTRVRQRLEVRARR